MDFREEPIAVEAELVDPPWSESLKPVTAAELRRDLLIFAGVELRTTQFYQWLKWAFIKAPGERRLVYSQRDRFLLLKFATEFAPRYPTLKSASLAFYYDFLEKQNEQFQQRAI